MNSKLSIAASARLRDGSPPARKQVTLRGGSFSQMNPENLKPSFATGIFYCGYIHERSGNRAADVVILAIETEGQTHYVNDELPVHSRSPLHELANAVAGNAVFAATVIPEKLLGVAVLAELVQGEVWSELRQAAPFPTSPRVAPGLGGSISRCLSRAVEVPEPPKPTVESFQWSVRKLTRPLLPDDLPDCVAELAMRSLEWRQLSRCK